MSVVSGVTIFCEGKGNSLDARLINRLIENIDPIPTIVPAGSKFTFSAFSEGYFAGRAYGSEVESNKYISRYIIFRDRDFDSRPTREIKLLRLLEQESSKNPVFLSYRTCVENYLLDATLIDQYWREKYSEKLENNSKWGHENSPGIEVITKWIEESARSLRYYQAVRWALGDLANVSAARSQLATTWTGGSGQLPDSLDLQSCRDEAIKLINQFIQSVSEVTIESFEMRLADYQESFNKGDFWKNKQYLVWFNGKDMQKEMARQRNNYPSLKSESFLSWAIQNLNINQHPDLVQLRTNIEVLGRPNSV